VTAWLALDDVDEANGCLRYIDGSHRGPILASRRLAARPHDMTPDPALIDLSRESLAPVKKGGVVFHHGNTLHASGPNTSARWRRAYSTHWLTAGTTCETDLLERVAYFRQPALWVGLPVTLPP
jgi:ectoine hydroxylase-related dioxygenase (phytanoyl-CoA dioxygenase family)